MFRQNAVYKIAAIVIAIALTVYVYGERNPPTIRTLQIPLETRKLPANVGVKSVPENVRVQVDGPKDSVMRVTAGMIRAYVSLDGLSPGDHRLLVRLDPANSLPPDIHASAADATVPVSLQSLERQTRPVEPVFLRPPPPGFTYGLPAVKPSVAYVGGPTQDVERVSQLQVVVDAVPTPNKTISGSFPIRAVDSNSLEVDDVTVKPGTATVQVQIQGMPAQKEIFVSPNVKGVPAPGFRVKSISVVPQSVTVTGGPDSIGKLNFVTTDEVDISGATTDVVRSVQMLLPDGVTAQGSRRVRVDVNVEARPQ